MLVVLGSRIVTVNGVAVGIEVRPSRVGVKVMLVSVEIGLFAVTVMGAEVVWFPAASRAVAVKVCDPLAMVVVSQLIE